MKKLLVLAALFSINVITCNHECTQPHTHDTHNVGHQFYDALVETPKDAIVKGAIATKDLTKTIAAAVVFSNAAHELKDAAKELVIDTPVKTAKAIKNGTLKAYDTTKQGAKIVYNNAVVKPARAINHAAHEVAESDFVQGTKETAIEVGEQFKEVGQDIWGVTKNGIKRAYHVLIEKPVGAVKAAGHYLAHGDTAHDDHEEHEHVNATVATFDDIFVLVIEETSIQPSMSTTNKTVETKKSSAPSFKVIVIPTELVQSVFDENEPELIFTNVDLNTQINLSEKTLSLLSQSYSRIATELSHV